MPAAFDLATAVELLDGSPDGIDVVNGAPLGSRRWRAELPESWDVPNGVHGGMLAATALRGARSALNLLGEAVANQDLRTTQVSFLARPMSHQLELTTSVLRSGGTTSHVEVEVHSDGFHVLSLRTLFARTRTPAGGWNETPHPKVPPPDASDETGGHAQALRQWPSSPPALFGHLDLRPAIGVLPWEPGWHPGAPARFARWVRYREAPVGADGALEPISLLPLADLPGPAVWSRFGPTDDVRRLVSLEMTVDLLGPARDEWVLTDFHARVLADGYVLVDADLWSGGSLVAVLRQTMLVRVVPRERWSSPDERRAGGVTER